MTRTKKIIVGVLAGIVALAGILVVTEGPAAAGEFGVYNTCEDMFAANYQGYYPYVNGHSIGQARLCLSERGSGSGYHCYSTVTFYLQGSSSCYPTAEIHFQVWDWSDSPGDDYVYLEYSTWMNPSIFQRVPGAVDRPGGSTTYGFWDYGQNIGSGGGIRFIRMHDSYTNAYHYIFKSTGAGGCGYAGITQIGYCPTDIY